jgi:hypothetical protein
MPQKLLGVGRIGSGSGSESESESAEAVPVRERNDLTLSCLQHVLMEIETSL